MKVLLKRTSLILVLTVFCQLFFTTPLCAKTNYGDLNGDNAVNAIDFAMFRGYLLGKINPSAPNWKKNADLSQDGNINAIDFAVFRLFLLGKIKTIPIIPAIVRNTPVPPTPVPPTPMPYTDQEDWIPFIPEPEYVELNLVIEKSYETDDIEQRYILATITFLDNGYRIVDEGKCVLSSLQSEEQYFETVGVKLEKYIGSNEVTKRMMQVTIKCPIENELSDINHFDFKVYDTRVTGFSSSQNEIIAPKPVPYEATVNKDFVDANTQFAANMFKQLSLEDSNKNIFFSPFSMSMALSMVYQGADTTTKEALAKVLNYTEMSTEEINQSYIEQLSYFKKLYPQVELNIANSIWVNENKEVEESFFNKNKEVFNSQNSYLDFTSPEACEIINKWISDATKDKINNMINPPIDPQMLMYLINAIYFKGSWMDPFDLYDTRDGIFTNIEGTEKTVPMMNKYEYTKYSETSEYRAVELPYGSGSVSMYCILPENVNVNKFISEFDKNKWDEIKSSLDSSPEIKLSIPKFKIDYKPEDLVGKLTNLGMGEAFSRDADFSGIADNMWIDDVIHKAVIDVNEKGTEAAAVTIIGMAMSGPPMSFIADNPFMFVIADNATGTILFMGKVVDIGD